MLKNLWIIKNVRIKIFKSAFLQEVKKDKIKCPIWRWKKLLRSLTTTSLKTTWYKLSKKLLRCAPEFIFTKILAVKLILPSSEISPCPSEVQLQLETQTRKLFVLLWFLDKRFLNFSVFTSLQKCAFWSRWLLLNFDPKCLIDGK